MIPLSIEAFERCDVDPDAFDHEAHVAIAWTYLDCFDEAEATDRFVRALRALTEHLGVPDKYHDTITRFYLAVIAERRRRSTAADWDAFRTMNPDLLDPALLGRHYSRDRLASDAARQGYVPPDLEPLSSAA